MRALATPLVAVVAAEQSDALLFSRNSLGNFGYEYRRVALEELSSLRPGSVFETGSAWEMVPAKLYRYEDRALYLHERFPLVASEHIGTVDLPQLEATGVYDRHALLERSLYTGNHVVELFVHASGVLAKHHPDHALVFFAVRRAWVVISSRAKPVMITNFNYDSAQDAVFYLAAYLDHYGMEREACPLVVGGLIGREGQLLRELSIYFNLTYLDEQLSAGAQGLGCDLLLAYEQARRQELVGG